MEILIIALILISVIISLALISEKMVKSGICLFGFSFILFVWLVLASSIEWRTEETVYISLIADNVACIVVDNQVINLNGKIQQNIPEGTKIKRIRSIQDWYGGIYRIMVPVNTYEIVE